MGRSESRTLLLLGGGFEQCAAVRVARGLGYRVLVADDAPAPPAAALADEFLQTCLKDPARFHRDLARLEFHGVFTHAAELAIEQAMVAERFGLPGPTVEAARRGTLKDLRIAALRAAGVRVPDFQILHAEDSADSWLAAAQAISYPLVAKPNDDKGARGVRWIPSSEDLLRYRAEQIPPGQHATFLLESFEEGLQLSTETLLVEGEARWTSIALRHYDGMERFHPFLIEDGHSMGIELERELLLEMERAVLASAAAIGLSTGVLKGDLLVPHDGAPFVLEMAVRTSGGRFADLVAPLHHGVQILEPLVRLAMGDPIDPASLDPSPMRRGVSQRFLYLPEGDRATRIPDLDPFLALPHVEEIVLQDAFLDSPVQAPIRSHHDRIGYVVCTGANRREADERALGLARELEAEMGSSHPLAPPPPANLPTPDSMRRTAVVIGAGCYVLGDSFGDGVVLPTLLDCIREGTIDRIVLAVRTPRDAAFHRRLADLSVRLGVTARIEEFLIDGPADLDGLRLEDAMAFLCTPDTSHFEYAAHLLQRRVPTWVVKPLTGTGAESEQLDALSEANATPLFVDYHKRFDPSFAKLKGLVDRGSLGRPLLVSVQYTQPARLPLQDLAAWSTDLDVFQYIGCHFVDLLFYLLPQARPCRVSATGIPGRLASEGGPRFDLVHTALDLSIPAPRSRSSALLRADFAVGWNDPEGTPAKSHQRVELVFERGRVLVDQKERGFEVWTDAGFEEVNPHFLQILPDPSSGAMCVRGYGPESIRRFLAVREDPHLMDRNALPWSRSAKRTDAILDGVRRSLQDAGAWVALEAAVPNAALPSDSVPMPEQALQGEL